MIVFKKREFNPANVTKEEARSIMGPHAEITDSGIVALTWHIAWVRGLGQVHISIDNSVFATRFVGKDLHLNRASNDFSPGGYFIPRWDEAALIAFDETHWAGIVTVRGQDYLCKWGTDDIVLQPELTVPDVAIPVPTSLSTTSESEIESGASVFYLADVFAEAGESLTPRGFSK